MKDKAFRFIDDHRADMLKLWEKLVNMESGSAYIEGVDAVAERVKSELAKAGAAAGIVSFDQAGNMARGEFPGGDKPPVLLLGHMDTVFKRGEAKERPFAIKDGHAYGPGVLDMKGGVVIAIFAARALKAAGFAERPLKLLFAGDEEIAHANSTASEVFLREAKGCAAAFDCETGFVDDAVVVGRKGTATFKVAVHGVSAHAGNDPKRGRSAILEMAHKVIDIQNLTNWEREYTFNVGVVKGGTVPNAVPGYCEAEVDIRYVDPVIVPELKAMVEKTLAKTYIEGTRTELAEFKLGLAPMQTTEGVLKLFALWKKVSEDNGFGAPTTLKSGGGSDAAYTVLAGTPTLCSTGVKGGKNHSKEEFAVVDTLFERAKLLCATILRLDGLK
jgi:glutamate carboxypeptidase